MELRREFAAEQLRRRDQQRRDTALAWQTAMLSRQATIPKLDTLLPRDEMDGGSRRQTPAEQRAVLYHLSEQYGIPLRIKH